MKQDLILKLIEMLVNSEGNQEPVKTSRVVGMKPRPVVVFANNCIIYGYSDCTKLGDVTINQARYCYRYEKPESDSEKGFMSLAKNGPAKGSKVSSPVDNVTVSATCFIEATEKASQVWENSEWK